jgi:hypothetical protein
MPHATSRNVAWRLSVAKLGDSSGIGDVEFLVRGQSSTRPARFCVSVDEAIWLARASSRATVSSLISDSGGSSPTKTSGRCEVQRQRAAPAFTCDA